MGDKQMGFGLFDSPRAFKGQVYSRLKKEAQESGELFVDTTFPPDDTSLFYQPGKLKNVVWKRPKDICENPQLFVEGLDAGDVHQGKLGNCWFVAACSCLTLYKEIWTKVIPDHKDQEWNKDKPENYQGIFHFNFWRYGEWVDIVIDDLLPTINGKLVFVHSQSNNEFWSALLEKAYAKLFGCYEALDGGDLAEALVDFTGGVGEPIDLRGGGYADDEEKRKELYDMLHDEMEYKSLMAAAIPAASADEMEASTDMGLVKGHAYGITAVKRVPVDGTGLFGRFNQEKLNMVRLRNPWGQGEWKGPFSDDSPEWNKISQKDREKIGLVNDDDGEFWMHFDDYCTYFTNMSICRIINTSFFSVRKTWRSSTFHGAWVAPLRAGGCLNDKENFLMNPQFRFDVSQEKADNDTVLISLMQKATRGQGPETDKLVIGFSIIKVELNRQYRIHKLGEVVKSSPYKNSRSILVRCNLPRGRYVIIPSTFAAGVQGEFLLRIYTGAANDAKHLKLEKPEEGGCFSCFQKSATVVTRITVFKATGLEKQDTEGGADPYCVIECEGEKVTTNCVQDSLNPTWNQSAIFYRRNTEKYPIIVNIWNKNAVRDAFMGRHIFEGYIDKEGFMSEVGLVGKKDGDPAKPGRLFVEVASKRDLTQL